MLGLHRIVNNIERFIPFVTLPAIVIGAVEQQAPAVLLLLLVS